MLATIFDVAAIAAAAVVIGPEALIAIGIAGLVSGAITGFSGGSWSWNNFGRGFVAGAGMAAAVSLAGFGTSAGVGAIWGPNAVIGAHIAAGIAGALTAGGIAKGIYGASWGDAAITAAAGGVGGVLSAGGGFNATTVADVPEVPAWGPNGQGGVAPVEPNDGEPDTLGTPPN